MARDESTRRASLRPASNRFRSLKASQLIANELRRDIIRGDIAPDSYLPAEAELMAHFGVARATLREAMRILESESLVTIVRGARGGARAHLPDLAVASRYTGQILQARGCPLEDVHAARLVIEPPAAAMAAARQNGESVAHLRSLIETEAACIDDDADFAEASTRFHEALVEASGNQVLAVLIGMLHEILAMHVEAIVAKDATESLKSRLAAIRSQDKLLELISTGDEQGAQRHWHAHVETVGQILLEGGGEKTVVDLFT